MHNLLAVAMRRARIAKAEPRKVQPVEPPPVEQIVEIVEAATEEPIPLRGSRAQDVRRVKQIQRTVAAKFDVTIEQICSPERSARLLRPRHISAYLCKVLLDRGYPFLGSLHGRRDHTTILSACRKIDSLRPEIDSVLGELLDILRAENFIVPASPSEIRPQHEWSKRSPWSPPQ